MLSTRKRQLAAKIESVEGTAETLAAADAIRMVDVGYDPDAEKVEVNYLDSDKSGTKSLRGKRQGRITARLPIKGSGVLDQAPEWGTLIRGCSAQETINAGVDIIYKPISSGDASLTLGRYLDGKLNRIWGARGNGKLIIEAGQPGWFEFDFLGADWDDADVAMLSGITYDATVPPIVLAVSMSIGGYSFKISRLELDMGIPLTLRGDINKASGHFSTLTGKRRAIGSMDPELMLKATKDIYQEWLDGTEGALTITLGSAAYNTIEITAPKVAYTKLAEGERGELATLAVDLELNKDSGDDEWQIKLT